MQERVDGAASGLEAHAGVQDLNERGPEKVEDNMLYKLIEKLQMLKRVQEDNMATMLRIRAVSRERGLVRRLRRVQLPPRSAHP